MKKMRSVAGLRQPNKYAAGTHLSLMQRVDEIQKQASTELSRTKQNELGQFFTSSSIASFMASLYNLNQNEISLLDAGAGVGTLTAAFIERVCSLQSPPKQIQVTAVEIEPLLFARLEEVLSLCSDYCTNHGIQLVANIQNVDFLQASVQNRLSEAGDARFSHVIMNPPYKKIGANPSARQLLKSVKVQTSNMYTAFLTLAMRQMSPEAEIVAITPRSFCNGAHFKRFRREFLDTVDLCQIHSFDSRSSTFKQLDVLQENIIFYGIRSNGKRKGNVVVSTSADADTSSISMFTVPASDIVQSDDPEMFIRLIQSDRDRGIAEQIGGLPCTLEDLGLSVSTGRVVDFRATKYLSDIPTPSTVPLLYPGHFKSGAIEWHCNIKKPSAIMNSTETSKMLIPRGNYVLVKRFSSKENKRRVVAGLYDESQNPYCSIGIENHLNYFHRNGTGLPIDLAKGLNLYLNSTLVDQYFRQFSGHTQVNVTDLRNIRYPSEQQLINLGRRVLHTALPSQDELDGLVSKALFSSMGFEDSHQA